MHPIDRFPGADVVVVEEHHHHHLALRTGGFVWWAFCEVTCIAIAATLMAIGAAAHAVGPLAYQAGRELWACTRIGGGQL